MLIVALLIVFLVCPCRAQAEGLLEMPTLTVTGTGSLGATPDTAFLMFGVETAAKSLEEAQRQNTLVMRKVTERLRDMQIEKERIQTSSFTVAPQYKPPGKRPTDVPAPPPEIIGYVVSNHITVEVRHTEKVGIVIEASLSAGANHFQGLHWALRDEQQAKLEALKQAAARAREKATALSGALNAKLIRLINANESGHIVRPLSHTSRSTMAMDAGSSEPPMSSGEMKVEATVTLIYEIGPE